MFPGLISSQQKAVGGGADVIGAFSYVKQDNGNADSGGATIRDFYWKPDGLKCFIMNDALDRVMSHTASAAFDIGTLSGPVDFPAYLANPRAVEFNPAGTIMFHLTTDRILRAYTGGSAWSSTGRTATKTLDATAQITASVDFSFGNAGLVVYISDSSTGIIYQYDLGTADDLDTASYASKSADLSSEIVSLRAAKVTSNGAHIFALDATTGAIYQYDFGDAYDLSTLSYSGNSLDISTQSGNGFGLYINTSIDRLWVTDSSTDRVYEYAI